MLSKDITIILLLYKTPLNVLNNLKNYNKFNVLILDQSNDYQLKRKIQKILPKIKYYKLTSLNKGFAFGINHLVNKVNSKYFLCTQPDISISEKSILRLKKTFIKKKDAAIVVPKIYAYKDYTLIGKKKIDIIEIDKMIGAVFLSSKKIFDKLHKFNEDYFFYWEDIDFSKRVEKSKYKIYLNNKSQAKHLWGKSTTYTINSLYIREVNFKFGEYLFQYNNTKLRIIKIFREQIKFILLIVFYLFTFQFKKLLKSIFSYIGILKFFIYLLLK